MPLLPEGDVRSRRVAAVVLPEILVEISNLKNPRGNGERGRKFVVVEAPKSGPGLGARAKVLAVSPRAKHLGVQRGLTVAEATGICADLEVVEVSSDEVIRALTEVAEVVRSFGSPVSLELEISGKERAILRDVVWLDVSGSAKLFGGERELALGVGERVRQLGFTARVVVAGGPRIARSLAKDAALEEGVLIVPPGNEREALSVLSIFSLGLEEAEESWLTRLGIWSVSALTALPPEMLLPRLGSGGSALWELATGVERTPLVPLEFPKKIEEKCAWDEPLPNLEPILFSLHGLVGRLSARLEGRGEATSALLLELGLESTEKGESSHAIASILPAPLHRAVDLERVLRSRLEKVTLLSRVTGLSLTASGLVPAQQAQLTLGAGDRVSELDVPVLLEELSSEIGAERFGLLEWEESHRPEKRSRLRGWFEKVTKKASSSPRLRETNRMTRLFRDPIRLSTVLSPGEILLLGGRSFRIARVDFAERLDGVEWWAEKSISRDYYWIWLEEGRGGDPKFGVVEALVFRDHRDERLYLQGMSD